MRLSPPFILLVCSANICRSPAAALLVQHRLGADLTGAVRLASAGVDAQRGRPPCEWTARRLRSLGAVADEFDHGGSQPVTEAGLRDAVLIISADRLVSSRIIRWDPTARSRLFTLKEAAALATLVLDAKEADNVLDLLGEKDDEVPPISGLEALVAEMDAARGWLPMERPAKARFGLSRARQWSKAFDVPDAHSGEERISHGTMFGELQPAAEQLAGAIMSVVDRSAETPRSRPAPA